MRFQDVVRIEAKPAPKREKHGKLIKVHARVSTHLQRKTSTWSDKEQKYVDSNYSSQFVDFIGFEKNDGTEPSWLGFVKPGSVLMVSGQVVNQHGKDGKDYTKFEIHEAGFAIGEGKASQSSGSQTENVEPAEAIVLPVSSPPTTVDDDSIPF